MAERVERLLPAYAANAIAKLKTQDIPENCDHLLQMLAGKLADTHQQQTKRIGDLEAFCRSLPLDRLPNEVINEYIRLGLLT